MLDLTELTAIVMKERGFPVERRGTALEHRDSGFIIAPVFLDSQPSTTLVRAKTAVTVSHPELIPGGVFEYQHAFATTLEGAIREGLDQWVQLDFVVFLDALRDAPERCQAFDITVQRPDGPHLHRRAVLGPVGHMGGRDNDEHPFCSCCFLTNTFEAFKPAVESGAFYGIRMFAAHNENGGSQADCRINGQDWETGKKALLSYADTWPPAGLEFRKQYIILQTRTRGIA